MTEDNEGSELTFEEVMSGAEEHIEAEQEGFEGDIPKHAGRLLVQRAADLNGTLANIAIAQADEGEAEITDEEVAASLEEDVVEVILAIGALRYEYDLDIESAVTARLELMEAVRGAETQEEVMRAMMGDEEFEEMMENPMMGGPEPGDDVSADDYDGEPRSFA